MGQISPGRTISLKQKRSLVIEMFFATIQVMLISLITTKYSYQPYLLPWKWEQLYHGLKKKETN